MLLLQYTSHLQLFLNIIIGFVYVRKYGIYGLKIQ